MYLTTRKSNYFTRKLESWSKSIIIRIWNLRVWHYNINIFDYYYINPAKCWEKFWKDSNIYSREPNILSATMIILYYDLFHCSTALRKKKSYPNGFFTHFTQSILKSFCVIIFLQQFLFFSFVHNAGKS